MTTYADAIAILRAADDKGTIQAHQALNLFPGRPELHTTLTVRAALEAAGVDPATAGDAARAEGWTDNPLD